MLTGAEIAAQGLGVRLQFVEARDPADFDRAFSDMTKARNLKILKRLPFFLDIVTMAVEAGMNLSSAFAKSVEKMPHGPLLAEVNRLLREVRAGKPRVDALRDMAARLDFAPMNSLVSALVQGELMGSSIGPIALRS